MGRISGTVPIDVEPGTAVYRMYSPQNAGAVIENMGRQAQCVRVRVRWLEGKTTVELSANLRLLQSLVDDHASKLRYSQGVMQRVAALIDASATPQASAPALAESP